MEEPKESKESKYKKAKKREDDSEWTSQDVVLGKTRQASMCLDSIYSGYISM